MKAGDIVQVGIYGRQVDCEVLAIHSMGTIDVMRLSDERCFRVSGLAGEGTRVNTTKEKSNGKR